MHFHICPVEITAAMMVLQDGVPYIRATWCHHTNKIKEKYNEWKGIENVEGDAGERQTLEEKLDVVDTCSTNEDSQRVSGQGTRTGCCGNDQATRQYQVKFSDYTLQEHIVGLAQLVWWAFVIVAVIAAMIYTAPFGLLVMGMAIWYGYYAAECSLNGGKADLNSLVEYAVDDFLNNFGPTQWQHRLELARGDDNVAKMFPGKIHCLWTHIVLPLIPLSVWIVCELVRLDKV